MNRHTHGVWTPSALAALPAGDQPEEEGRLLCRLCGRWFRALGHHILRKHGINADAYREQFELPAGRGLAATDLREAQAERGAAIVATNPRARAGFLLDPTDPTPDENRTIANERRRRLALGATERERTQHRAGVRDKQVAHGKQIGGARRQWAATRREEIDQDARRCGYHDFADLLEQTRDLSHPDFAAVLGWPVARATWWRRQHGYTSRFHQLAAQRRAAAQSAGLTDVPAGTQPTSNSKLRCLDCGRWFIDLNQHLRRRHHDAPADYRRRHQLPPDIDLRSPECRQTQKPHLADRGRRSAPAAWQKWSDQARQRWDHAAREHGYPDITAMLSALTDTEITAALTLRRGAANKIRHRYLPPTSG